MIRTVWFPNHRATATEAAPLRLLRWHQPGTWNYRVSYIIDGGMLLVHGDIGEAVYSFGGEVTFERIAQMDIGYFAGKCEASETGRQFRSWDGDRAVAAAVRRIGEYAIPNPEDLLIEDAKQNCGSDYDWVNWLNDGGGDALQDDDHDIDEAGWGIHIRCIGHLIGIKMAVAQLTIRKES